MLRFVCSVTRFHISKSIKFQLFLETKIEGFDPSLYNVEQVFYKSKDETKVPMFIASRKDEKKDGTSPCLLYGYGGFNISLTPRYFFFISPWTFVYQ